MIDYLNSFIFDPKVTEDDLINYGIKILVDCKVEIFDKLISKCRTGNFYHGKYNDKDVIIKRVNIANDDYILNEFIFWQRQIDIPYYIKMLGVYFYKYFEVFIIFDDYIESTLETKMEEKNFSEENKMKVAGQLCTALNYFNKENILHLNLRSDTIGLDYDYKIKILEVDSSVLLKTQYDKEIITIKKRYLTPEYYYNNKIHETFDNYSFGVILHDLFFNRNDKISEKNINCLLYGIIFRCLEDNYNERIKNEELNNNFKEYYDFYYTKTKNKINDNNDIIIDEKKFDNDQNYINNYNYAKNVMDVINTKNQDIKINIQKKIQIMKNELTKNHDNTLNELEKTKNNIIKKLENYIKSSKEIINTFYDKIITSITKMQIDLSNTVNDLLEVEKLGKGMLCDLYVFSKFSNKIKYKKVCDSLNLVKERMSKIIKINSIDNEFDLIYKIYNNNYPHYERFNYIINEYKSEYSNLFNMLKNLVESNEKKKIKELEVNFELVNEKNSLLLSQNLSNSINDLNINKDTINNKQNESKIIKSMYENIYAKIEENSK